MSSNAQKARVACLPISLNEDPHQREMLAGLNGSGRIEAFHGKDTRIFPAAVTTLVHWPDFIHFDWNYRYLFSRNPVVTVVGSFLFLVDIAFCRYVLRRKIVWSMHNVCAHNNKLNPHTLFAKIEHMVQPQFIRLCHRVRAFNQPSVDAAVKSYRVPPAKFAVYEYPATTSAFAEGIPVGEARQHLGLPQDKRIVLCFGSIRRYKDLIGLAKAFAAAEMKDTHLIIAGRPTDKPFAAEIAKICASIADIRFIPESIPEDMVAHWFCAADAIVLPYHHIDNSGPLVIAMHYRRAVIAPAFPQFRERLAHQSELLYPEGNIGAGLAAFEHTHKETLASWGEANHEKLHAVSWEDFADFFNT